MGELREIGILEYSSRKGELFKETMKNASTKTLENCFKSPAIQRDTEKCCKIYVELYRRKHGGAKKYRL